jgi:hypothetical protein
MEGFSCGPISLSCSLRPAAWLGLGPTCEFVDQLPDSEPVTPGIAGHKASSQQSAQNSVGLHNDLR